MANYRDVGISDAPFKAGVDLTQKQYYWVAPGSVAGEVIVAVGPSGNPWPLGILQNSPSSGQEAQVRVFGFSKSATRATNLCSVAWGRFLLCGSDGFSESRETEAVSGASAHTGSAVVARYMDSGTLSVNTCALAQVLIFPFPQGTSGVMGAS